jgi:hypothetical protein
MPGQSHHVFRRTLEIRAPTQTEASAWRQRIRPLWQDHLAPALERAFDQVSRDHEVLRAPRLEIEIHVSRDAADSAIEQVFAEALRDQLHALETDSPALRNRSVQQSPLERISVADREREWMETFLRTGVLPRWAGVTTQAEIEEWFLRYVDATDPVRLREVLLRSPKAARRLSLQLSAEAQVRALARLLPAAEAAAWTARWNDFSPDRHARAAIASGALEEIGEPPRWTAAEWESLWQRWAATGSVASEQRLRPADVVELSAAPAPPPNPELETGQIIETQPWDRPDIPKQTRPLTDGTVPPNPRTPVHTAAHLGQPPTATSADRPATLAVAEGTALPVANAGIVLLAPFLPALFSALGVAPSAGPDRRPCLPRATLLLHYLSTGETAGPEPLLVIPKLLCGLALEEPVPYQTSLPPAELAEVDSMMTSAIGHWTALGKTSIVSLRTAFLQRPGLLRDNGPVWELRVEHRSWDVLLDRIPWGFRTICLPWMPKAIAVEWTAYA